MKLPLNIHLFEVTADLRDPAGGSRMTPARLYSKVWPMLSIFDSNKQKTLLEISVVFDRWGAVL
jgi:hypothetical protein